MNSEVANMLIDKQLSRSREVLIKKAQEYATDGDRLYNFKAASGILGAIYNVIDYKSDEFDAIIGMQIKHFVSMLDLIQNAKQGSANSEAVIDEKLGDFINYSILLMLKLKEQ